MRHSTDRFQGLLGMSLAWLILLVACSSGSDPAAPPVVVPPPPPPAAIVRVEVSQSAMLMTAAGETVQLTATAYDAAGATRTAVVNWTTSNSAIASVNSSGLVRAEAGLGSSIVTAVAEGINSDPITVLVAQPVPGALLVSDAQVIGGPVPVDINAAYAAGFQYDVILTGVNAPTIGDIVISSGSAPVAGRVVAVLPAGSDHQVTLELVPVAEMFSELQISEQIVFDVEDFEVNEELASLYDTVLEADGSISFNPRSTTSTVAVNGKTQSASLFSTSAATVSLAGLKCEWPGQLQDFPVKLQTTPNYIITVGPPILDVDYSVLDGLKWLHVSDSPKLEASLKVVNDKAIGVEIPCSIQLGQFTLPITGALSFALGGWMPFGFGFKFGGNIGVPEVGFDGKAVVTSTIKLGLDCTAGCEIVNEFENDLDFQLKLLHPDQQGGFLTANALVEPYLYLDLSFGSQVISQFLSAAQLKALKAQAGAAQKVNLMPSLAQANDDALAAGFGLDFKASIGAATNFQNFLGLLGLQLPPLVLTYDAPLATSPTGVMSITPGNVSPGNGNQLGDIATFNIVLDKSTYLAIEAIDSIEIMWLKDGQLQPGRPGCNSIPAVPGQTVFTCETDFLQEHSGNQTFVAFMNAKLFGVPLPGLIEIANNGKAVVGVATGTARVQAGAPGKGGSYYIDVALTESTGAANTTIRPQRITASSSTTLNFDETLSDNHAFSAPSGGSASGSYTASQTGSMTGTPDAVWGYSAIGAVTLKDSISITEARENIYVHSHAQSAPSFVFQVLDGPVNYTFTATAPTSAASNVISLAMARLVDETNLNQQDVIAYAETCAYEGTIPALLGNPEDLCQFFSAGQVPSVSQSGVLQPGTYSIYMTAAFEHVLTNSFEWYDLGVDTASAEGSAGFTMQIEFSPVE